MDTEIEEPKTLVKPERKNGFGKLFGQFKDLASTKLADGGRVAIFTHPNPDPDAMASQMGMARILSQIYGADCDLFFAGEVSHPQNQIMRNLLGINLIPTTEYHAADYTMNVLVDVITSNAGTGGQEVQFDVVIDHHVDLPLCENCNSPLFINLHTGSCVGTIFSLMKYFGVELDEDEDADCKLATALMVGIMTDTKDQTADRTTHEDQDAYKDLFPNRDAAALQKILRFKRPRAWVLAKAAAANEAVIEGSVACVGLGMLSGRQRDMVADMADEMLSWDGVEVAIAFALIDGHTVEGSVRSNNASHSAALLSNELAKEPKKGLGSGWGYPNAGGYRYCLGGMGVGPNDDEEIRADTWALVKKRETKTIMKLTRK